MNVNETSLLIYQIVFSPLIEKLTSNKTLNKEAYRKHKYSLVQTTMDQKGPTI